MRIIVSGPESTGKTTLCEQLASHFNAIHIPEYARKYVEGLKNKYTYQDVINIAEYQIKQLEEYNINNNNKFIFFDTGLIITKIWFKEVFGEIPNFLLNYLNVLNIDLFLLCYPDIPWVPDKVRENGGEKRFELFNMYKYELDNYNFRYKIIKGDKKSRFETAKKYISSAYCLHNNL